VLGATLVASVVVAVIFGALPLLQSRRQDLHESLQGGSGRGASGGTLQRRLRSSLVVAELAMAVTLMTGAGVLMKSLWRLQDVDPGFQSAGVLKAEFQLPLSRYAQDRNAFPEWPAQQRFYAELESRIGALAGVSGVAVAAANPLDAGFTSSIVVVGREAESEGFPEPSIRSVSASYFSTMRVPVATGRGFAPTDAPRGAPVVVINESASERFFNGRQAVGQRIRLWGAERTVVGVVGNERFKGVAAASPPAVYLPLTQAPIANAVLIRTGGDPASLATAVRAIVRDLDPMLPLFGVEPLQQTLSNSIGEQRFTMLAIGAFAAIALLLSALGVHGVLSYTVSQRTREIGIRIALGANPARVRVQVVSEGALLAATGIALGLLSALAVTRTLSSLLFEVGARDPWTFGAVAVVLGVVALMASYLPARRASRLDPVLALRAE
jgi:predicted permease